MSTASFHTVFAGDLPEAQANVYAATQRPVILPMAQRARAEILELEGSHVIMISQPQRVAEVILTAPKAVSS